MFELLKPLLNRIILPTLISLLVFFVGKGWLTNQESEQIAAAVTLLLVNVAIGLLQKFIQSQKVQTALELPANSSKEKLKKEINARGDVVSVLSKIIS
jgi:accessory gene regulator protein AgrB